MAGKNPYPGINAHLNSALQPQGWQGFHNKYLTYLSDVIGASLPDGYYTSNEESLQLAHMNLLDESNPSMTERIRPDILIRKNSDIKSPEKHASTATVTAPSMTRDLDYLSLPEDDVRALVIHKFVDSIENSIPVTRIELLSPANKPPASYYATYIKKREASLWAGLNLVEIDFFTSNTTDFALLPQFYVPLDGDDKFILDLAQVYDNSRLFQQLGNPASELKNPEAYSLDDRAKLADFVKKITSQ